MSTTSYGPTVPDGQYPPFSIVTPTDHSAWVLIATTLGLVCALLFGAIRIFIRLTINPRFGLDDYILGASTMLAVIQSGIVLGACAKGFGKSVELLEPRAQTEVARMYYASNLFFSISLGLSKISVMFFFRRLSPANHHQNVFSAAIVLLGAWTIGSFLALALQCSLAYPWVSIGESCPGTLLRWQVICAFDIAFEVMIVALAVYLVRSLRIPVTSKAVVVGAFSARLLMILAIGFRLDSFDRAGWTTNPFLLEAPFVAWTQSEMNYSIISATIPSFQNFLKNLNTHFGGLGPEESEYGYGSGSRSRDYKNIGAAYQMSTLRSENKSGIIEEGMQCDASRVAQTKGEMETLPSQSFETGHSAEIPANGVENNNLETLSVTSCESRRLMIRKEVTWNIVTQNG